MQMPGPPQEIHARASQPAQQDGRAASARGATPKAENGAPRDAPRPEETRRGGRCGRAERGPSDGLDVALRHLFRGLRAGDLESVLLTVAMAADESRMPSADPDEEARILAFLARLAEHDAELSPPPSPQRPADSGAGAEAPVVGGGPEDRAPGAA